MKKFILLSVLSTATIWAIAPRTTLSDNSYEVTAQKEFKVSNRSFMRKSHKHKNRKINSTKLSAFCDTTTSDYNLTNSLDYVTWSYSGDTGPEFWGDLSPEFEMCSKGVNQSPINITDSVVANLDPLQLENNGESVKVFNNGHTVEVEFHEGSILTVDGKEFTALQYHFHTPSENMIDGKSYDMEAHIVHASEDGELAVISVLYEIGNHNDTLDMIVNNMPTISGDENNITELRPYDILPENKEYYRYNGSLTTPPCSEKVRWFVMKDSVTISEEQWTLFNNAMGTNNRPIQPLGARKVMATY